MSYFMPNPGDPEPTEEASSSMAALLWLWNCEAGHWRNLGERYYPADEGFEVILASLSDKYGLPADHGVELFVADDRQSWTARRELSTGEWLAAGAIGGPPDLWVYQSETPPGPYPAEPDWHHLTPTPDDSDG